MGYGWGLHEGTWKMGTWGQNIVLETLHFLVGDMFWGLKLSRHWNTRWAGRQNLTCFDGWEVLRFKFWGSCFKVCDFKLVETSTGAPPKHDMFLCWFAPNPTMLVHGNPHWATWKRLTHLWFVIEIMSGIWCTYA
jgi:hypothetical protein